MSAELYSINSQLWRIQSSIWSAKNRLEQKKEELQRLMQALSDLRQNKSDFINMKRICKEPELTPKTLHGDHANKLDTFRKNELQVNFLAIPYEQISSAETAIRDKVLVVQNEITALESSIAGLESSYAYLVNQKHILGRA